MHARFLRHKKRPSANSLSLQMTSKGFTLIELIVVAGVIALLGSFAAAQFGGARARTRDAERERNVKTLQNALALYANSFSRYPPSQNEFPYGPTPLTGGDQVSQNLLGARTINAMPHDPIDSKDFVYQYASQDGSDYTITYFLEADSVSGKPAGIQFARP